jgi:hypothetical protein
MNFLKHHQQGMEILGFWTEQYRKTTLRAIEQQYETEIIREWQIVDFVPNADQVLIKWVKRHKKLSDDELMEQYGRRASSKKSP